MRVLVVGTARVDAGKTTFSTGLLARLGAVGFKPRAGNDYWFDHDDYRAAVEADRLYGKDARRLADASGPDLAPEDVNPVHRLWRPAPGPGAGLIGRPDRQFVLDRVGDEYVVNADAAVPASAREHLPLADAHRVETVEALNRLTERHHEPALRDVGERIRATETAVVESYGDIALPVRDVAFDAVAAVEPGRARLYDGDRYLKACEVAGGGTGMREGRREKRVESVTGLLDPRETVRLPALTGAERADPHAVRERYEPVYDLL